MRVKIYHINILKNKAYTIGGTTQSWTIIPSTQSEMLVMYEAPKDMQITRESLSSRVTSKRPTATKKKFLTDSAQKCTMSQPCSYRVLYS